MPATELNRVTLARFNRAAIQILPDRIVVLYEFTSGLELIRASFGAGYWAMHEILEHGKLDHSRATCPDRNGPRELMVWEPGHDWQRVPIVER